MTMGPSVPLACIDLTTVKPLKSGHFGGSMELNASMK